jgi:hypothetical protein
MCESDIKFFSENLLPNELKIVDAIVISIKTFSELSERYEVEFVLLNQINDVIHVRY